MHPVVTFVLTASDKDYESAMMNMETVARWQRSMFKLKYDSNTGYYQVLFWDKAKTKVLDYGMVMAIRKAVGYALLDRGMLSDEDKIEIKNFLYPPK